jgi:ADP-ribose pyrophosphatase YjhB (NUDIX family)
MDSAPCTYRISIKAIITDNDGNVLLLKDKNGEWELPGGGLEHGENIQDALAREISEETNMTLAWMNEQPQKFWTIQKDVGSPTLKWFAFVAYEAKVSGELRTNSKSDEAQEAKYFSHEQAILLDLHDNTKPYFI